MDDKITLARVSCSGVRGAKAPKDQLGLAGLLPQNAVELIEGRGNPGSRRRRVRLNQTVSE